MRLQRDSYAPKSCAFDAANVQFLRAHLCKSHPVLQQEELLALWHEAVVLSVQIELKKTIEKAQPHLNKAEFGRWLKNKRETEAMSMDKLASVLRLSLAEYVAYESGQKAPDSGLRKVVRRIFGPFFPIKVKKA